MKCCDLSQQRIEVDVCRFCSCHDLSHADTFVNFMLWVQIDSGFIFPVSGTSGITSVKRIGVIILRTYCTDSIVTALCVSVCHPLKNLIHSNYSQITIAYRGIQCLYRKSWLVYKGMILWYLRTYIKSLVSQFLNLRYRDGFAHRPKIQYRPNRYIKVFYCAGS